MLVAKPRNHMARALFLYHFTGTEHLFESRAGVVGGSIAEMPVHRTDDSGLAVTVPGARSSNGLVVKDRLDGA